MKVTNGHKFWGQQKIFYMVGSQKIWGVGQEQQNVFGGRGSLFCQNRSNLTKKGYNISLKYHNRILLK